MITYIVLLTSMKESRNLVWKIISFYLKVEQSRSRLQISGLCEMENGKQSHVLEMLEVIEGEKMAAPGVHKEGEVTSVAPHKE